MATLTPDFADFLPDWISTQRWYRGKSASGTPQLRPLAVLRWEDAQGEVGMESHILLDESDGDGVVYQVPLSYRSEPVEALGAALVATTEHTELGTRYVYDATHDPVFARTMLEHIYEEHDVPSARAHRIVAGGSAPVIESAAVISGEQSNTSVVVWPQAPRRPVILKVFRVLHSGHNPDVEVQTALTLAGARVVPGPIGYVEGRWSSTRSQEGRGDLVFAQEYLPDTEDAWRTALVAARADQDFSDPARELGVATARMHAALAECFGSTEADADRRTELLEALHARAEAAYAQVPELETHREAIAERYQGVFADPDGRALPLQRVHGDYHLGQVLDVPGRGWIILDFEGEPLRPLAERTNTDLALRDVAGMLRSFDYAAATVVHEGGGDRSEWAEQSREAFLEGYLSSQDDEDTSGLDADLLQTLELDKALYEVDYEARNRPSWLPIPLGAVTGLLGVPTAPAPTPAAAMAPAVAAATFSTDEFLEGDDVTTNQNDDVTDGQTAERATPAEPVDGGVPVEQIPEPEAARPEAVELEGVQQQPEAAQPEAVEAEHVEVDADEAEAHEADDEAPAPAADGQDLHSARPYPPASGGWSASGSASGGLPHAPIPPPVEMLEGLGGLDIGLVPPGSIRREEYDLTARTYPPASGSAGGHGDPELLRAKAWEEAQHSTEIVTGGPALESQLPPGVVASGAAGAPATRRQAVRSSLQPPTEPPAPHTRPLDLDEATDLVHGMHRNPHSLLGPHLYDGHVTIRTLQPEAVAVSVMLPGGRKLAMTHETGGIWAAVLPDEQITAYRLEVQTPESVHIVDEAYRHSPALRTTDLQLIDQGQHEELWRVLGSHVTRLRDELGEITGTRFTVWAPNALAVHVVGDFNGWDGARHAMRSHDTVGVWEVFIPGVTEGAHYKYDITGPDGVRRSKADPMARASEVPPFNNSVVTVSRHRWRDDAWMARRAARDIHHGPMSIYEMHLGSWRKDLSYEQLADELVAYVSDLGFTHVEFMPVMQHPYGGSWGYHVTGYYAADSRFGHEDGLRYLIDRLHQAGVGVILDWVPGHFATDPWALARFDGTPIYEHPDPRKGWHPEWGSYIFDFGRPQVRNFLVANATYWLEEFHADGLRVDGVASMLYLDYSRDDGQWIPNKYGGRENLEAVELLQQTNATAYRRNPGVVMIAEESTSWPGVTASVDKGGLGFGFKWNMGWMHDTLGYLSQSPYARAHHHHAMTFSLVYAYSEKFILPISHDEVVHGKGSLVRKMSGDMWQRFANTRAFMAYKWSHPGKQLLFMGSEFAQLREWADSGELSWELLQQPEHAGVLNLVRDLNRLYHELPALWEIDHHSDGFAWLDANDAGRNQFSYLRWGNEGSDGLRPVIAVLVNFSGLPHQQVHVGLPYGGRWREVLNTDAEVYGGAGQGNMGSVQAYEHPHQRQPYSALVTVPPMGAVWLVPEDAQGAVAQAHASAAEAQEARAAEEARTAEQARAAEQADTSEVEPVDVDVDANVEAEVEAGDVDANVEAEVEAGDVDESAAEVEVEPTEAGKAGESADGQVSEVSGLAAQRDNGADLTMEASPTQVSDTTTLGALDREPDADSAEDTADPDGTPDKS